MRKRKTRRKRVPGWMIPSPVTTRKIRNRGFTPICYVVGYGKDEIREVRFGWLVKEQGDALHLAFADAERLRIVRGRDRRHVYTVEEWREANKPPAPKEED